MKAIAAVLVVLISGCASGTRSIAIEDARTIDAGDVLDSVLFGPSEDRSIPVTFIREGGYVGSRMETMLVIDGQPALLLKPATKAQVHVR
ncbi:hypothetical protein GGR62_004182 [Xanthomonas campestris]|nr:hypothetical protein [Xanthomonas sp. 3075]